MVIENITLRTENKTLKERIDELQAQFDSFMLKIYPIGSIYMSIQNISPNTLFGGEWESWGSGRVPVGVDTEDKENSDFSEVEKTGGSIQQDLRAAIGAINSNTNSLGYLPAEAIPAISYRNNYGVASGSIGTISISNHSTPVYRADGDTPRTLQPYITCYMWKRIA